MYEMSQRHPVWVAENRVKPCNSAWTRRWYTEFLKVWYRTLHILYPSCSVKQQTNLLLFGPHALWIQVVVWVEVGPAHPVILQCDDGAISHVRRHSGVLQPVALQCCLVQRAEEPVARPGVLQQPEHTFMNICRGSEKREVRITGEMNRRRYPIALKFITESIATLPPFGPIQRKKWFDQMSSQWESRKNRLAFISSEKSSFTSQHLKSPVHVVPLLDSCNTTWRAASRASRTLTNLLTKISS